MAQTARNQVTNYHEVIGIADTASTKTKMFIRFVVTRRLERSGKQQGVFSALYALEREGKLEPYEIDWFHETEEWFDAHLKRPDRFAKSTRPNARQTGISWFKASAVEHIKRMRDLAALLRHKDIAVDEFKTEKPGYVLYEDDYQVTASPFSSDTF